MPSTNVVSQGGGGQAENSLRESGVTRGGPFAEMTSPTDSVQLAHNNAGAAGQVATSPILSEDEHDRRSSAADRLFEHMQQ